MDRNVSEQRKNSNRNLSNQNFRTEKHTCPQNCFILNRLALRPSCLAKTDFRTSSCKTGPLRSSYLIQAWCVFADNIYSMRSNAGVYVETQKIASFAGNSIVFNHRSASLILASSVSASRSSTNRPAGYVFYNI